MFFFGRNLGSEYGMTTMIKGTVGMGRVQSLEKYYHRYELEIGMPQQTELSKTQINTNKYRIRNNISHRPTIVVRIRKYY